MIEIGNERTFEPGARRVAGAFDAIGGLLIIAWLARVWVQVTSYSAQILLASFAFGLTASILRTRTSMGSARAVSSFFAKIAVWAIITIILIWILGWIAGIQNPQNAPNVQFPSVISQQVPNLAIAAIATGIISLASGGLAPRLRGPLARGPALVLGSSSSFDLGKVKFSVKIDMIALPIRRYNRTLGAMVYGDLSAVFDTPMGTVTGSIPGPITTVGIPFKGERAESEDIPRLTGKSLHQLIDESHVDTSVPHEDGTSRFDSAFWGDSRIDMPFVHVSRGIEGESVEVGPVTVRKKPGGEEEVKVGPFSINSDDWDGMDWARSFSHGSRKKWWKKGRFGSWWLMKGNRGASYVMTASFEGIDARWNGSALRLREDWMKMTVGSDGFTYSPTELETYSPLHTLHITQSKVTLNTRKFTLLVSEDRVVLRSEEGTKSTNSADLARDLRGLLAETAKKHVKDVMDGIPIDLSEMLTATEEVLAKHD